MCSRSQMSNLTVLSLDPVIWMIIPQMYSRKGPQARGLSWFISKQTVGFVNMSGAYICEL